MADNTQETRMDQVERYLGEFTIEFAKGMLELKESQKKTDAQILGLKEYHRQTEELLQKTIKEFRATQKLLGDLGLVQGEVAEDLFYRNVKGLFSPRDLRFERIRRNVKVKGSRGEYDIVADDNYARTSNNRDCPNEDLCNPKPEGDA